MKKILCLLFISLLSAANMISKENVDINVRPEALEAKEFNFPKYETVVLKNGLKVYVITDDQQPTLTFRVLVKGGSAVEGAKTGLADVTAQLLTKGAGDKNAFQIASALDGVGAGLNVSATADYNIFSGSMLKKHLPLVFDIAKDIITKPTFPQDELEKIKKIMISNIKQEKSRSSQVAAAISRKALYGLNHPYAAKASEETINSITLEDVKEYFNNYYLPNNATISVIGDISPKEAKSLLEKYFSSWEKGKVGSLDVPNVDPLPIGVYFVSRPTAVQSSVVVATQAVPRNHPDYDILNMSSSVIGAGFAGRLFRTLREQYSYTYTPYGYLTSTKFTNRFACGADVRGDVTDSSIIVIMEQLRLLANDIPSDDEINRLKKYEIGQYLMSFSNAEYVGSLIQAADFYGMNIEDVKNYHKKMQGFYPVQIQRTAAKYMNPNNAYIIVVGKPDVLPSLEKFGKIYEFNMDYEPLTGENAKMETIDMTAEQLLDKFASALGGKENINNVKVLKTDGDMELFIQGEIAKGKSIGIYSGNKSYLLFDVGSMKNETFNDGNKTFVKMQGSVIEIEGEDKAKILDEKGFVSITNLAKDGFTLKILGKQKNQILLHAVKGKNEIIYYFNSDSYLLDKKEFVENIGGSPIPVTEAYTDYKEFSGIKLPTTIKCDNPVYQFIIKAVYNINEPIDDSIFTPAQ